MATLVPHRNGGLSLFGALLLLLFFLSSAHGSEAGRRLALLSDAERRGHWDELAATWSGFLADHPDDETVPLICQRLLFLRDRMSRKAYVGCRSALRTVAESETARPEARRLALRHLHRLALLRGDGERAAELRTVRGTIRNWWVIGPFGSARRAAFERPFPVEWGIFGASGETKTLADLQFQEKDWVRLPNPGQAAFDWEGQLAGKPGAVYAFVQIQVPQPTEATLVLRTRAAHRIIVDGQPIATINRHRADHPAETHRHLSLSKGWHRLLVKFGTTGVTTFEARLVDRKTGRAVAGLTSGTDGTLHPQGRVERLETKERPGDEADALALAASGLHHVLAGAGEHGLAQLTRAVEKRPDVPLLFYHLGRAYERAYHLPEPLRRSRATRAHKEALRLKANLLPAHVALARLEARTGRVVAALRRLEPFLKADRASVGLRLIEAELYEELGWAAEREEALKACLELESQNPRAHLALGRLHLADGAKKKAMDHYEQAWQADRSLTWLLPHLGRAALARGNREMAEETATRLSALAPREARKLRAAIAESSGDVEAAATIRTKAAESRPRAVGAWMEAARTWLLAGHRDRTASLIDRVLSLDPSNPAFRRLQERLTPSTDFRAEFEPDLDALIANAPGPDDVDAPAVALFDQTILEVFPDGGATTTTHRVHHLLTEQGVRRFRTLDLPGEILRAQVFRPNGEVLEPTRPTGDRTILLPALEPGATIVYAYRLERRVGPYGVFEFGPFYFQDPGYRRHGWGEPIRFSRLIAVTPSSLPLDVITRHGEGVLAREERRQPGRTMAIWTAEEMPGIRPEPMMPDPAFFLPHVILRERVPLSDIAWRFRDDLLGRTKVTAPVRNQVTQIAGEKETPRTLARKLYRFVMTAIQPGGGANTATDILEAGRGERIVCLKALLDAAGIRTRVARGRPHPRYLPPVDWKAPRPREYDTPLLRLEFDSGPPVWIAPDIDLPLPFGRLPYWLWGGTALILADGPDLLPLPNPPLDRVATKRHLLMAATNSGLFAAGRWTERADWGYALKARLRHLNENRQQQLLAGELRRLFPGARIRSQDVSEGAFGQPLRLDFEAFLPEQLATIDGQPALLQPVVPLRLSRSFHLSRKRQTDLIVSEPRVAEDETRIELGPHLALDRLPGDILVRDRFGTYALTYRPVDGGIVVERSHHLEAQRVSLEAYDDFVTRCRLIDAAENRPIRLRKD